MSGCLLLAHFLVPTVGPRVVLYTLFFSSLDIIPDPGDPNRQFFRAKSQTQLFALSYLYNSFIFRNYVRERCTGVAITFLSQHYYSVSMLPCRAHPPDSNNVQHLPRCCEVNGTTLKLVKNHVKRFRSRYIDKYIHPSEANIKHVNRDQCYSMSDLG